MSTALLGALGVALVVVVLLRVRSASATGGASDPALPEVKMREMALGGTRVGFGLPVTSPERPAWGVLMETGYPEGTATLLSLSDGTTSLYFSSGGGIIGGGTHENVRSATLVFVEKAGASVKAMNVTKEFPRPATGLTTFYVLTEDGVFTGTAPEAALGSGGHSMSPLFYSGQSVLTQLRQASGK